MQLCLILALSALTLANAGNGKSGLKVKGKGAAEDEAGTPYLLPLRRESVPVYRNGQVVSLKTAYSGKVSVGGTQEFSVVFDTGSGHLVLPSSNCEDATCLAHRRYNITDSSQAWAVNADSTKVPEDELCDQATIGYGTGTVTGEFVHDSVCLGPSQPAAKSGGSEGAQKKDTICTKMNVVVSVEMSAQPFESYEFDGIFGLGLDSLALTSEFSFFSRFSAQSKKQATFGFFLSDGEHGEQSEISFGGHNSDRVRGPLAWAPVASPKLGFWNVKIRSVRIGGVEIVNCKKGACKGILDTGTSHLGVPSQHMKTVTDLLTKDVAGDTDCRVADAPDMTIDINGFLITLRPQDYMPSTPNAAALSALPGPAVDSTAVALPGSGGKRHCQPRVMPVDLQKNLGPNLFILGEPVLHRYYTVYDWHSKRVGFGLANSHKNRMSDGKISSTAEVTIKAEALDALEGEDEEVYLMQMSVSITLEYESLPQESSWQALEYESSPEDSSWQGGVIQYAGGL